jgi:hypothetical protein
MAPSTRIDQAALILTVDQQLGVITREQTVTVGLTRHALRHRLRLEGPWQGLLPGVYLAATGTPTLIQQEMAAMLYAGPGSVITGLAAVRQHHIRGPVTELIDVLVPASRRRRDADFVRLHRTTRLPTQVWQLGPLRYVLPARAVADAVRDLTSLRDVRAMVADAVQRGHCRVPDLCTELNAGPSVGSKLFREALTDVADGIRSAAEGDLKNCWRNPACRCHCSTPPCMTATGPSSPGQTPGGPTEASLWKSTRTNGTCRRTITLVRSSGSAGWPSAACSCSPSRPARSAPSQPKYWLPSARPSKPAIVQWTSEPKQHDIRTEAA